ncbi:MAG: hypothetical protein K0Q71_5846 [Thermomicrobiales bacterium]|jgi:hypothetical protein|nr:hypothetical protein [Thermomicrobiales bacterium]
MSRSPISTTLDPSVIGEIRTGPARRAFREKFHQQVDPDGCLPADERSRRADEALRSHMAELGRVGGRSRRPQQAAAHA